MLSDWYSNVFIVNEVVMPIVNGLVMLFIFMVTDRLVGEREGKEVAAKTALVDESERQAGTQ